MRPDEFTPAWPGQAGQTPAARPADVERTAARQFDMMVMAIFLGSAVGAVLGVVVGR